jgi:hypothetical protein
MHLIIMALDYRSAVNDTMGGNTVVLDLGSGVHAFCSHLQPGSIRVKAGDRVRVGQILGLVGNSGNGNAPHPSTRCSGLMSGCSNSPASSTARDSTHSLSELNGISAEMGIFSRTTQQHTASTIDVAA